MFLVRETTFRATTPAWDRAFDLRDVIHVTYCEYVVTTDNPEIPLDSEVPAIVDRFRAVYGDSIGSNTDRFVDKIGFIDDSVSVYVRLTE